MYIYIYTYTHTYTPLLYYAYHIYWPRHATCDATSEGLRSRASAPAPPRLYSIII